IVLCPFNESIFDSICSPHLSLYSLQNIFQIIVQNHCDIFCQINLLEFMSRLIKKRYYVTYLFNFYPFLLSGCIIIRMTTQRLDLRPMGPMRYIINEQRLKEKVDVIAKYLEERTTKILINDLLKLKIV
ncbi:hypothetical protein GQX74_007524, partial [Glossina fuscipes]